ncbi:hypothetical protein K4K49_009974 [Colletotrichum sp. SAR 10_70]|nr:hypothetical protein CGCSCA1_v003373 [Colletotrichum siamense]KAI8154107.1 hypothetical protein K4K49_009974 [Colletotrichum sp. SAR 10_70]KAI8161463.1 hypothetical protein K4K50_001344 [Colletotrichum sp. SAR 10_71]KAI8223837.1 hypothetical protein K4K54_005769 [Colletotrichum sp. SAR 10_86]
MSQPSHDPVQTAPHGTTNTYNNTTFPLKGGCACGNIRYALTAAPLVVHCCHCTSCQRETGTAFAVNAVVEGELVTLLPGGATTLQQSITFPPSLLDTWTPRQARPRPLDDGPGSSDCLPDDTTTAASPILLPVPAESGAPQNIARCPVCLTAVWSNYDDCPLLKFLRVGTLDAPAALATGPDLVHIFVRSKLSFFEIPDDGKLRFEGFYPQKEGVWRPEAMVRREKLLARIAEWEKEKEKGIGG